MKEYEGNHRGHRGKFNSLCSPNEYSLKDVTEKIIFCAIKAHSILGQGLLESIYEQAYAYELEF